MFGFALVDTTASVQFSMQKAARLTTVSSPSGTRISAKAETEVSLSATLSRSVTALGPATLGAVIGTASSFGAGRDRQGQSAILNGLLGDLADTLSKGQGGYFISYQGPHGGGMAASVTPNEFAALVSGQDGGSFNGVSLGAAVRSALADATKQAAAAAMKEQAATVGRSPASPEQTALTLITRDQVNGTLQTKAKADVKANGAAQIRLLIDKQAAPDGTGVATVTIAYVPPSETSVMSERTTETNQSSATLDVTT